MEGQLSHPFPFRSAAPELPEQALSKRRISASLRKSGERSALLELAGEQETAVVAIVGAGGTCAHIMRVTSILLRGRPVWKLPMVDPLAGSPPRGTRRSMIIPEWIGKSILVHSGKLWKPVAVSEEMIGYRLGDFVLTKKPARHESKKPGKGKTRGALGRLK